MSKFYKTITLFSAGVFALSALNLQAEIPYGYYSRAEGKQTAELKTALSEITEFQTTQSITATYSNLSTTFKQTDVRTDPNDPSKVYWWDMYSNEDFSIEDAFGDHMNREHSFPKSWWGGLTTTTAYCDLNHLFPGEARANQTKSNWPLGIVEVSSFDNGAVLIGSPRAGYGGGANCVFEPGDEYKGDFARAYFYMVTRYQDLTWDSKYMWMVDQNTYPTLQSWAVDMLLQWHRNDPVSQKELDRNEKVYEIQHNRNPFIDYPQLAEYIWGSKMGETFYIASLDQPSEPVDPEDPETPQYNDPEPGEGTQLSPLTVAQVLSGDYTGNQWVAGYIVGWVANNSLSSGARFDADATRDNCVLIADYPDVTDYTRCTALQLPTGDIRAAINLKDNPGNLGRKVGIYGSIETYFGIKGVKSISEYSFIDSTTPVDPETPEEPENPDEPETPAPGDGTEISPLTVAQVIAGEYTGSKWVEGYIVGWVVANKTIANGATFNAEATTPANILLADYADTDDYTRCIPVQLAAGDIRNAVNLMDNPENFNRQVKVCGSLEKYYNVNGVKSLTDYAFIDVDPEQPEDPEEPDTPVDPETPEVGDDVIYCGLVESANDWIFVDELLPAGIDYVWSWKNYGSIKYLNGSAYHDGPNSSRAYAYTTIDMRNFTEANLTFEHAAKFQTTIPEYGCVVVRPADAESWTYLAIPEWPTAGSWSFAGSGEINLTPFIGNIVDLGLFYMSNENGADTWEIRNFTVRAKQTSGVTLQPAADTDVRYYNLQGIPVANPTGGIYIVVSGNHVGRVLIR